MIVQMQGENLAECLDVIHRSFSTVADEFSLTPQNCATNGAFMPISRLQRDFQNGDLMFGLYESEKLVGFMQIAKKINGCYELEKLGVLPEYRHRGYGKNMIDFARNKVMELGGNKIHIGIIEENTRLKTWYAANGFIHMGTRIFAHLPFTVGFMELPCSSNNE